MKLTARRQEILTYLTHCGDAKTAAEIQAALPHINLVTIYRALELLATGGALKKIRLAGDEASFEVQHEPHHHALCTLCGKVIHFTTNDAALEKEFSLPGFIVDELEVTLKGRCRTHKK